MRRGWLTRLDPRTKILGLAALAVTVALTSKSLRLGALALGCLGIQAAAGRPSTLSLRRFVWLVPLLLFLATSAWVLGGTSFQNKFFRIGGLVFKTLIIFWIISLLKETTPFNELLRGLRRFGVPVLFTEILFFAFRYKSLLFREAERIRRAVESRSPGQTKFRVQNLKWLGTMTAHLLTRTLARSDRIYAAMLARGYADRLPGELRRTVPGHADFLFLGAVISYLAAVLGFL